LWSVLSALHPAKDHNDRLNNYTPFEHEFDEEMKGIEFPVKLTDIEKFENRCKSLSINVYCYTEKTILCPLRITKTEKQNHIGM
jgi:hypothetical protein